MISSQNQDQLSPLLDQISSQLAEEQFPWQPPVPPQKDAWYAIIFSIQTFFKLLPLSIFSTSKKKIFSVTCRKKTTLLVSVPEETPGYHPTPESSPELTKRSWSVILSTAHVIILVFTSCHCLFHIFKKLGCTLTLYLCSARFGSLMSTEKDESYTVVVKGKALASIKVSEQLFCPPLLLILDLLEG